MTFTEWTGSLCDRLPKLPTGTPADRVKRWNDTVALLLQVAHDLSGAVERAAWFDVIRLALHMLQLEHELTVLHLESKQGMCWG